MTVEPYYIIFVIFWAIVLLFNFKEIKNAQTILNTQDRRYIYWTQIILLIGVLIRTAFPGIPIGIFPDEAMSGYDSWCIANYGVDLNLASHPVYLKSWGSGMNALYAYIAIPFIKLFGLSLPVFRLPMALISCASLLVFYYTLRKTQKNYFFVLLVMLLIVVSPWHIMKSRWALESNIAPDLILIGTCLLILGYYSLSEKAKRSYFFAGFAFWGLSAYGYAVTWFMLPLFCIFLFIYFYKKKRIKIAEIVFYLIELLIIVAPLLLFVFLIVTEGQPLQIGSVTIPTLDKSRHSATTLIGEGGGALFVEYMKAGFKLLIFGDDTYRWNSFYLFGQFYNIVAIPFILISFFFLRKKGRHNIFDTVFIFWLIASIPIILLVEPNTNHWNMLWFPLIYFVARGIYLCVEKFGKKWVGYSAIAGILLLFIVFSNKYISFYKKVDTTHSIGFLGEFDKYIDFVKNKDFENIYFSEVYALALFYDPVNPYVFSATKTEDEEKRGTFNKVVCYNNYKFYMPELIEPTPKTAYIFRNSLFWEKEIDLTKFHVEKGEAFTLIWND
jgi:hypothetical protein